MNINNIKTLGDLKKSGYKSKSIKEELRENLISKIMNKESAFQTLNLIDLFHEKRFLSVGYSFQFPLVNDTGVRFNKHQINFQFRFRDRLP